MRAKFLPSFRSVVLIIFVVCCSRTRSIFVMLTCSLTIPSARGLTDRKEYYYYYLSKEKIRLLATTYNYCLYSLAANPVAVATTTTATSRNRQLFSVERVAVAKARSPNRRLETSASCQPPKTQPRGNRPISKVDDSGLCLGLSSRGVFFSLYQRYSKRFNADTAHNESPHLHPQPRSKHAGICRRWPRPSDHFATRFFSFVCYFCCVVACGVAIL
jgi:hypothetical protein